MGMILCIEGMIPILVDTYDMILYNVMRGARGHNISY